jgi:hypothetical protein
MHFKKDEVLFRDIRFLIGAGILGIALLALSVQYHNTF